MAVTELLEARRVETGIADDSAGVRPAARVQTAEITSKVPSLHRATTHQTLGRKAL